MFCGILKDEGLFRKLLWGEGLYVKSYPQKLFN